MSHRNDIGLVERAIIGRTLRLIASQTMVEAHCDYLTRLAHRFDPKGDNVTTDEARMVDWLLKYASDAGQQVQEVNAQLEQIKSDQAAAQPTVDRLTALYQKNNPAAAPQA